jgi:hypothetical protein
MKRTRINAKSAKRKIQDVERFGVCMPAVRRRSGGRCEVKSPVCTGKGEHGHEILKSSQGGSRTDPANVLDSCDRCNSWLETLEGRRWGLKNGKVIERRSLGEAV